MKNIKIGIDIRTVSQGAGVATYVNNVIPRLLKKMENYDVYLFSMKKINKNFFSNNNNVKLVVFPIPKLFLLFYDWFCLPVYCYFKGVNIFHGTKSACSPLYKLFGIKTIVNLHDVIPLTNPETERIPNYIYWKIQIPLAYYFADSIITLSNFSSEELIRRYKRRKNLFVVYASGNKIDFENNIINWDEFKQKNGLAEKYLLYVGTLQPRKNVLNAIKAFCISDINHSSQFVVVGKKGWLYKDIFDYTKQNNLEKKIIFLDYISNSELDAVYNHASAFIYISSNEGFGLPIIEAMEHNLPVITSSCSCLPEIAGDTAVLVDPTDINGIANAINKVFCDENLREQMIIKGKKNILKFNWETTAEEIWAVYQKYL
ncbi:MAG: glycosyltransferase family 1 protein [Patescibacteria group bacterium]